MIKNYTWSICTVLLALMSCGTPSNNKTEEMPNAASNAKNIQSIDLANGKFKIDVENSVVNWRGTEITGKFHVGTVQISEGTIKVANGNFGASVAVDMQSIECTDEKMSADSKASLVGHLQSDDFFGVEQFPYAKIFIREGKADENGTTAFGEITVRGITQPIAFPVNIRMNEGRIIGDAQITFNRAEHNVKFRSGAFPDLFPDLGDKLINDEIELDVHIETVL